jgi:hypothetical protein
VRKSVLVGVSAALGLTVLNACGSPQVPTAVPASTASAPSAVVTTSSASPSPMATAPSPTPTADEHKLGSEQRLTDWDGDLRVAVLSYKQPVAKSAPQPDDRGYEYGSLVVKVCNSDDHTQTGNTTPFQLVYSDDTEIESTNTGYNQFPKPEFPWGDHALAVGRCVKGSIVFEVPKRMRPKEATYVVDSFINDDTLEMTDGTVYFWKL